MIEILLIALAIYLIGVVYLTFFVAAPILASADCDHAWLIIAGWAMLLVPLWPLALVYFLVTAPFQREQP